MLVKEVETTLLEGMCRKFSAHGFVLNKNDKAYHRISNNCIQTFYLLIFKKDIGVYIEPRWSIKLKEILDIYHKVASKEKKYFKYTPVLENSLGELIEFVDNGNESGSNKSVQYLIENDRDITTLIEIIPKRFEKYVLPYFNQNSNIARVDKLLNTNPRELSIHHWLYPLRACMGIIAAQIVHNPIYNDLVNIYEEELQEANLTYKMEFEKLISVLNKFKWG